MDRKKRASAFIILLIFCIFLSSTVQGSNTVDEQKKCELWWQNYDVIFDNITYGDGALSFTLNNTGAEEVNIRHIGVNYGPRGPVTGREVNITLKPHSGRLVEIPTSKEPNRIIILTDKYWFFTEREGSPVKVCEEIAESLQSMPNTRGGWTEDIKANKYLPTILPITLALILFLTLLFSMTSFKTIKGAFSKISKKTWIILALIFLLGFILRMWIVPHVHYIHFDEDMYLDMGKNIAETGKVYVCDYYSSGKCLLTAFYPMAVGFPFTLALAFKLFGASHAVAFNMSALFGSLSIILIFFIAYLLFKKEEIGLWSALVLCLSPALIKWSGSAMPAVTSLFFILLSLLAFLLYFRLKSPKILFLSFCILAFTIYLRLEFIVLLSFLIFLFVSKNWKKRLTWKLLIILLLFLFLISPQLLFTYNAYFKNLIATSPSTLAQKIPPFQQASFLGKFASNLKFWVDWNYNLPLFSLFFLFGAFYLFKKRRLFFFLVSFFLIFIGAYSLYHNAPLAALKQTRYFMLVYLPFVIFCGYGIHSIFKKFLKRKIYAYLIIVCILLSFSFYLPRLTEKETRVSDDMVVDTYSQIPNDSTIVTYFPFIFSFLGKNVVKLDAFLENQTLREEVFTQTNQLIFFRDEECMSGAPVLEPYKTSSRPLCEAINRKYNLSPVITNEKDCFSSRYDPYWRRWTVSEVKCGYYLLSK